MVVAHVKPLGNNHTMCVNPFAMHVVKTAQIHCWWYEEIARIEPAQRISDHPGAYISVVNESSAWLFSSMILCDRLSPRFLAAMQQWYIAS